MADQTTTIPKGSKMTTLGEIPSEWDLKIADDFCAKVADGTHATPKQTDEGKSLVTSKHIKDGRVDLSTAYKISEEDFFDINKRSKVDQWDVLFSMIGTVGEIALIDKVPEFAIKNVGLFKCGDESKAKWLFYFLRGKIGQDEIRRRMSGTTQAYVTLGDLRSFPVIVPGSEIELKSIVAVLSSLDDKIELLREQNKTLEATAQAIFKEWFVNFNFPGTTGKMVDSELGEIPEGWRVGKLGNVIKTILGGTPNTEKKEYWQNGTIPWINSGKVNDFRIFEPSAYITEKALGESAAKLMPKGTVVIAITGATLGQISRLEIESTGNQSVIGLIPNERFSSSYLYYWMVENVSNIINTATGGAQQHINKNDVNNFDFIIPPKKILEIYFNVAGPIIEKISGNCFQIQTLTTLRDTLLPKLMKGEVRVAGFND